VFSRLFHEHAVKPGDLAGGAGVRVGVDRRRGRTSLQRAQPGFQRRDIDRRRRRALFQVLQPLLQRGEAILQRGEVRRVAERIREGMDITSATMDESKTMGRAESNLNADRDEEFNTRFGSFRGSQMAIERVKPILRDTAQIRLAQMIVDANLTNTSQVVDYMIRRFMRVPPGVAVQEKLVKFLNKELGTDDVSIAQTYLDQPLRLTLHLIMSQPEYQLC